MLQQKIIFFIKQNFIKTFNCWNSLLCPWNSDNVSFLSLQQFATEDSLFLIKSYPRLIRSEILKKFAIKLEQAKIYANN